MRKITYPIVELRSYFRYEPETGEIFRLVDSGKKKAGDRAERMTVQGYFIVKLPRYVTSPAHRVAWALIHGVWPSHDIDHINGDKSDNRLFNLRDVPHLVNLQNRRKASVNSKTGVLGVSESGSMPGLFRADIHMSGKQILIGHFKTIELAQSAYINAKRDLHAGCTI